MKETKFYVCEHCGNMIGVIRDAGVPMMCCGQKMTKIEAGTVEASREKHIPVVSCENGLVKVNIGSVDHPMIPEHYIEWIALETTGGRQRKTLSPTDEPKACFALCDDEEEVKAVYAYCNLHSLWKA